MVVPGPDGPVQEEPAPAPEPAPDVASPFAGGYRLSINDTRGPRECLTYAVGWMRVLRDGTFVLWARNPEHGGAATVTGEVLRNGKLVFTPALPPNVRAHIQIGRDGRCVSKLFGRYLVVTPDTAIDAGDAGDEPADTANDTNPALGVVRHDRKKKAGVVIGFRR